MMADAALEREYEFDDRDFDVIRRLIHERTGISLCSGKQNMVYARLARRLRARGLQRFRDYLSLLQDAEAPEWQEFINSLTTNLTYFFRESHHFPLLAEHARHAAARGQVELWSCASSTGEEPYSMAMTMVEAFDSFTPPVRILATDIDTQVLRTAEAGVYPMEKLARLSPERLRRFFLRGTGRQAGQAMVRPELRKLVSFAPLNLLADSWSVRGPFSAIFCRNVMIYFDKPTQYRILSRFAKMLDPDGLMFAGHSEIFLHATDLFRPCGKTLYRLAGPQGSGGAHRSAHV